MKDIVGLIVSLGIFAFIVFVYVTYLKSRKSMSGKIHKSSISNDFNGDNQKPYNLEKDVHIIKNILVYFFILSVLGIIGGLLVLLDK